jgi:uncharacterized membrane protein
MPEDHPSQETLARISERLDDIETTLREQIARTHALEQRLGLAPPPVSHSPKQTETTMVVEPERSLTREPDRDLETLIGGTWFNRIGIVALIFGVGYFLRGWVGPRGQVLIGVAIGIGLLIAGERIRTRGYRSYAQGLSGGGIAVLYLTFYAAFARYGLIGQAPALLLMSIVTATAVLLAARYDALAIAILGLIGGFLTPLLLSTGHNNEAGLFTYIALLDAGVLALAYFRQWRAIDYLAFCATILVAAWWMVQWYSREKLWLTIFFFTLFFLIFVVLSILHNAVNRLPARPLDVGRIFTNALIYFVTCYLLLERNYHPYLGLFAVLMSAFYLALGYFTYTRDRGDRLLISTFIVVAATFITLAVPIQLDRHWVTIGWAIEGGVLSWIGLKAPNRALRYMAVIVFALALLHWFVVDFGYFAFAPDRSIIPIFNRRAFSALVLVTTLIIAARLYHWFRLEGAEFDAGFMLTANVLLITWLSADLSDYFNSFIADLQASNNLADLRDLRLAQQLSLSVLWAIYGGVMLVAGIWRSNRLLRIMALGLLALTIGKVFLIDLASLDKIYRIASFVVLGAILLAVSFLYQKRQRSWPAT